MVRFRASPCTGDAELGEGSQIALAYSAVTGQQPDYSKVFVPPPGPPAPSSPPVPISSHPPVPTVQPAPTPSPTSVPALPGFSPTNTASPPAAAVQTQAVAQQPPPPSSGLIIQGAALAPTCMVKMQQQLAPPAVHVRVCLCNYGKGGNAAGLLGGHAVQPSFGESHAIGIGLLPGWAV